jgi:hypothetical protein
LIRHQDRDRLIVKYYQEGKSYRQIAQLARISVRDIKPILEKYGADKAVEYSDTDGEIVDSDSLMPISSRAYKLFSEFLTPLDAATTLHIGAPDAIRLYNEYLELSGRGTLAKLFKELSNEEISWLLRLCAVARSKKMSISQVIECVSIYCEDLPMLKQLRDDANNDLEAAQEQVFQYENRVEYLNHLTKKLVNDVEFKQTECEKIDKEIRKLVGQVLRLRSFVLENRNNNRTYIRIEEFVEKTVDKILKEGDSMKLLEFALISVLKSLPQKDQYKYRYLLHRLDLVEISGSFDTVNNMPTTNLFQRIDSNTIVVRNSNPMPYTQNAANHYLHSNMTKPGDHCPACYEKKILAMSKTYFENLKQLITDEVMSALIEEKAYPSSKMGV